MPTDAKPRARHGIRAPLAAKKAHWNPAPCCVGQIRRIVNSQFISIRKEKASAFFKGPRHAPIPQASSGTAWVLALEHHRTTDAHTSRVLGKADTGADKHLYVH